jgi:hypothetical protein
MWLYVNSFRLRERERERVKVVLCSWSARPRTQHGCHHDTKVKPEAAIAVIELLMMGGKKARNMLSCK